MSWYLKICKGLFYKSVLSSLLMPVMALTSQLCLLVAFFLPLKILILLGNSEVPHYFPDILKSIEYRDLVVFLAASATVLYLLHLVVDVLVNSLVNRQVGRLIDASGKLELLPNQRLSIEKAYRNYVFSIAGIVFILFALICMLIFYPKNAIVLMTYCCFSGMVFYAIKRIYTKNKKRSPDRDIKIINALGGLAFFFSAALMIYDSFEGTAPGIIIAMITLIMVRQAISQLRSVTRSLYALFAIKDSVSQLLFDDFSLSTYEPVVLGDPECPENDNFALIRKVVLDYLGNKDEIKNIIWRQSGELDVECFSVSLFHSTTDLFIRLFPLKKIALKRNEEQLLLAVDGLPTYKFLCHKEFGEYYFHIFQSERGIKPDEKELASWRIDFFVELMLNHKPTEKLEAQYRRSYPLLWQRINSGFKSSINLAVSEESIESQALVSWFNKHLDEIEERLRQLPLSILNTRVGRENLKRLDTNGVVSNYWGRWTIDPIGAGWPVSPKYLEMLGSIVQSNNGTRDDLSGVYPGDMCLSALIFKMEYFHQSRNYSAAIALLPQVRYCFENRDTPLS